MRTGVILVTYGEPQRNTFSSQWLYSYRILKQLTRKIAKIPKPLLPIIATARARGRVRLWADHEFVSPLEPLHQRTVEALRAELASRGHGRTVVVTSAFEFRRPSLSDVLAGLSEQGCERAVIVPMYVGAGDFTDGITRIAIEDALARDRRWSRGQLAWCGLSDEPETAGRLADILAEHCLAELRRRSVTLPSREWALLLAAHGTVVNPPAGVDNGLSQFERVLRRLEDFLKPHFGTVGVGWLNHTRGGRWTTPPVPEALTNLVQAGYSKVAYFPWGFTTDNAETVLEGRVALRAVRGSLERVEHLPCLNDCTEFVSFLADRVCAHLDAPSGIVERPLAAATV